MLVLIYELAKLLGSLLLDRAHLANDRSVEGVFGDGGLPGNFELTHEQSSLAPGYFRQISGAALDELLDLRVGRVQDGQPVGLPGNSETLHWPHDLSQNLFYPGIEGRITAPPIEGFPVKPKLFTDFPVVEAPLGDKLCSFLLLGIFEDGHRAKSGTFRI